MGFRLKGGYSIRMLFTRWNLLLCVNGGVCENFFCQIDKIINKIACNQSNEEQSDNSQTINIGPGELEHSIASSIPCTFAHITFFFVCLSACLSVRVYVCDRAQQNEQN